MPRQAISLKITKNEYVLLKALARENNMAVSSALRFAALERRFPDKEPADLILLSSDSCSPSPEAVSFASLLQARDKDKKIEVLSLKRRVENVTAELYVVLSSKPKSPLEGVNRDRLTRDLKRIKPDENMKEYRFVRVSFSDEELEYVKSRTAETGCSLESYLRRQILRAASVKRLSADLTQARRAADALKESKLFIAAVNAHAKQFGAEESADNVVLSLDRAAQIIETELIECFATERTKNAFVSCAGSLHELK